MATENLTHPMQAIERLAEKTVAKKATSKTSITTNGNYTNGNSDTASIAKKATASKQAITTKIKESSIKKAPLEAGKIATNKKIASKEVVTPKKAAAKKTTTKTIKKDNKEVAVDILKITFQLKFQTKFGQNLFITGNHPLLGNGDIEKALPLQFLNEEFWSATIELDKKNIVDIDITYNYILKNADGITSFDWGNDKSFNSSNFENETLIIDSWNHAGYFENAFYTEPFQNVLLKENTTEVVAINPTTTTHTFSVKAPLLAKGQTLCIIGNTLSLSNWNTEDPILMSRAEGSVHYKVNLNLSKASFPIVYKYGVYDVEKKEFITYEDGNNRLVYDSIAKNKKTIVNDAFAVLPTTTWKGAGIAIPVFSLRTKESFGVGEFSDLKLLVDWSKKVGLKLIQILPINDTTATNSNADSYPYAAISAFALHPIYINLYKITNDENSQLLNELDNKRKNLNSINTLDYENVMKVKMAFIKKIYPLQQKATFATNEYQQYFQQNKHWLVPYAAFCYLRDEYGTAHYDEWPAFRNYKQADIDELTAPESAAFNDIGLHYFIQYHLHLQLKEATEYAHANGIIVKGDIAIGIYRYGTDAWQQPELYNMNVQAGAPPDDFAVKGQNWGFPTYNWQRMKEDGFAWWKQRFEQMSYYFDAFRIDHILGFFRIWSIPTHAVEGIMGYFVPAIPMHINEFNEKGIWFNYDRYTKPFITENILWEVFGNDNDYVKNNYLNYDDSNNYTLKQEFTTQIQIEKHFASLESNEFNDRIKLGLFGLISNVILFEVEGSQGLQYHFRFAVEDTSNFKNLEGGTQQQLKQLYVNYFFRRQDDFWMKEALLKLPALKRVTNMLVCGEDLGLVPDCLPDVMKQLGLLSLEIQRMPKNPKTEFFHPNDAPYLSVVTPSTHDMSTIRGWWEEDKAKTQKFYNNELGQWGNAPEFCEAWINKAIVIQHLYSPAMWSVFQLQDLLGMDETIRKENPNEERINIPSNPKHFWCYRMHLNLEDLQQQETFNAELKKSIQLSGR